MFQLKRCTCRLYMMLNITAFKTLIYSWNTSTWLPQFKKVREKSISSRSWKVRDFHIKSGKIYISESSQGKEKFQVNMNSFILFGPPSWWQIMALSCFGFRRHLMYLFKTGDTFLTSLSFDPFVMQVEVGLRWTIHFLSLFLALLSNIFKNIRYFSRTWGIGLVKYCLMKLSNKLMLGFQENQSFFQVTLRTCQFIQTVCELAKS